MHAEEVRIWVWISAVVTDEAHQPIVRVIPHDPSMEAVEGVYPVDINHVLSYVS